MSFALDNTDNTKIIQSGTNTTMEGLENVQGVTLTTYANLNFYDIGTKGLFVDGDLTIFGLRDCLVSSARSSGLNARTGTLRLGLVNEPEAVSFIANSNPVLWFGPGVESQVNGALSCEVNGTIIWNNAIVYLKNGSLANGFSFENGNVTINNGVAISGLGNASAGRQIISGIHTSNATINGFHLHGGELIFGAASAGSTLNGIVRSNSAIAIFPNRLSDITLTNVDVGGRNNVVDVAVQTEGVANTHTILLNCVSGANLVCVGGESTNDPRNRGTVRIRKKVQFISLNADGEGIVGTKIYIRDKNNGQRKNLNSLDDTEDKIYNATSQSGGIFPTLAIDTAIVNVAGSNPRGTSNAGAYRIDFRGQSDSALQAPNIPVSTSTFVYSTIAYNELIFVGRVDLIGADILSVSFNLVTDLKITQTSKTIVDAYTKLDTSLKLYDRSKSFLVDNYAGERSLLLSIEANVVLFSDYDIELITNYNESSPYTNVDYVYQNNKIYRNSTAINTGEAFNLAKWSEIASDIFHLDGNNVYIFTGDIFNGSIQTTGNIHSTGVSVVGSVTADRIIFGSNRISTQATGDYEIKLPFTSNGLLISKLIATAGTGNVNITNTTITEIENRTSSSVNLIADSLSTVTTLTETNGNIIFLDSSLTIGSVVSGYDKNNIIIYQTTAQADAFPTTTGQIHLFSSNSTWLYQSSLYGGMTLGFLLPLIGGGDNDAIQVAVRIPDNKSTTEQDLLTTSTEARLASLQATVNAISSTVGRRIVTRRITSFTVSQTLVSDINSSIRSITFTFTLNVSSVSATNPETVKIKSLNIGGVNIIVGDSSGILGSGLTSVLTIVISESDFNTLNTNEESFPLADSIIEYTDSNNIVNSYNRREIGSDIVNNPTIIETVSHTNSTVELIEGQVSRLDEIESEIKQVSTQTASIAEVKTAVDLIKKYHNNKTNYYAQDGTTLITQSKAYFVDVFDDDGSTRIKRIRFLNASGNVTTLANHSTMEVVT